MPIVGLDALVAKLRAIATATPTRAAAALYAEAGIEMTEAKRRTPVETGALRSTGVVADPEVTGARVTVLMGFGGPAVDYAVPVHENLEAHHPRGQAKFLESVLNESAPFLAQRIGTRLQIGSASADTSGADTSEE